MREENGNIILPPEVYIYVSYLLEPHQTVDDLHTPREVWYPGRVVLLVYLHHRRHTRHVHYNCDDKGNLAVEGGGEKKIKNLKTFENAVH